MAETQAKPKKIPTPPQSQPSPETERRYGNLRVRLAFIYIVITLFLGYGIYRFLPSFLFREISSLETTLVRQRMERAQTILKTELESFHDMVRERAKWTPAYDYLSAHYANSIEQQTKYVNSEVRLNDLIRDRLNYIVYIDEAGLVFLRRAVNLETREEFPFPEYIKDRILSLSDIGPDYLNRDTYGFYNTPEGLHLVAVVPIQRSDGTASKKGSILAVRTLKRAQVEAIGKQVSCEIERVPVEGDRFHVDLPQILTSLRSSQSVLVRPIDEKFMGAYSLLPDLSGKSTYILLGKNTREVFQSGVRIINGLVLFVGCVLILFAMFSFWQLDRLVLNRLIRLETSVREVTATGDPTRRVPVEGEDTVAQIAEDLNRLFQSLELAQEEIRQSEASLLETQKLARVGTWEYNPKNGAITWSPELFRIANLPASPDWGIPLGECQKLVSAQEWKAFCLQVNRALRDGKTFHYEATFTLDDGQERFIFGNCQPIKDKRGMVVGIWGSLQDLTELQQAERARTLQSQEIAEQNRTLQAQNQQLSEQQREMVALNNSLSEAYASLQEAQNRSHELYQSLPLACFTFDKEGRVRDWNKAGELLTGIVAQEAIGKRFWEVLLLPNAEASCQQYVAQVYEDKRIEGVEWSMTTSNGTPRTILFNAYPLHGTQGSIVGGISACVDISSRKQVEADLKHSQERFELAVQGSKSGLWEWNLRTDEIHFSEQWKRLLGYTNGDLPSTLEAWKDRVHPEDYNKMMLHAQRYLEHQDREFEVELRLLHRDGNYRWMVVRGVAMWDDQGVAYRFAGSLTDITDRKQYELKVAEQLIQIQENALALELQRAELMALNRRLEALATQDGLTGIKNHRAMQEHLEAALQFSLRYGDPLSLMLIDVDNFKQYNDSFGHLAGDEVLKKVAQILHTSARNTDLVARYGGEEFVIVMPHTDAAGAFDFAERLRKGIERSNWGNRPISVSIGISTRREDTLDRKQMILESDAAMYTSKIAGKNRTTHYDNMTLAVIRPR